MAAQRRRLCKRRDKLILTLLTSFFFFYSSGDVDARVRAIALHVLGLQTVMWNEDADDWCLRNGKGSAKLETCETGTGKSYKSVVKEMKSWAKNDQSKGFIS